MNSLQVLFEKPTLARGPQADQPYEIVGGKSFSISFPIGEKLEMNHSIQVYQDGKFLATLQLWRIDFLPGWSGQKLGCFKSAKKPQPLIFFSSFWGPKGDNILLHACDGYCTHFQLFFLIVLHFWKICIIQIMQNRNLMTFFLPWAKTLQHLRQIYKSKRIYY